MRRLRALYDRTMRVQASPIKNAAMQLAQKQPQGAKTSEPVDTFCEIRGESTLSPDQAGFVRQTVDRAVRYFQDNFGEVQEPVVVDVDPGKALRTGFNIPDRAIHFPPNELGVKAGLDSKDIITHEVFHALTLQAYPQYCTDEKTKASKYVRLHEGLADYFTHQLYPDEHFAEDREGGTEPLRSYRNARRLSLSAGAHAQGNAITSYLLKHQVTPTEIKEFLQHGDFTVESLAEVNPELRQDLKLDASLKLDQEVSNYPQSSLNRYRLEQGKPLELHFKPNDALLKEYPHLSVEWVRPSGMPSQTFVFDPHGERDFSVTSNSPDGSEKVLALFKDGEDLLGARPFYLGTAKELRTPQ